MTLTLTGTPTDVGGGSRPRTFDAHGNIVHLWFETETAGSLHGERMFATVLAPDGTVRVPPTSLGDDLDFETTMAGFGQNAFHVSEGPGGAYVIHYSQFINGHMDGGTHVPYAESTHSVSLGAGGALGTPVMTGDDFIKFEESATTTLSNGNIAVLERSKPTGELLLKLLGPDGVPISQRAVSATLDTTGVFAQVTAGLGVIEADGRILTLHRDAAGDDLYGQMFALDGTPAVAEFRISTGDHGDESNAAVWQDGIVDAAVLTDGRVAVVWADSATGSDGVDVWLSILNADGSVAVTQTPANAAHTEGEQFHPRVYALADGSMVITYAQNYAWSIHPSGYAQQFDSTGNPVGNLLSFGGGTSTGSGDYGHIFPDGTGLLIDWYGTAQQVTVEVGATPAGPITGTPEADTLNGTDGADEILGLAGADRLLGMGGADTLRGGDGPDTLNGGDGDDMIRGGDTDADRRDVIYGGAGNDSIDAGHGNDLVYGQGGNDTIAGGFGADELQGQDGDDVITGSAFGDIVFGNAGDDFVNGGFGHDLINGGAGADKFFHTGGTAEQMEGHGSDWVQDYSAAEGDVLVFGGSATASQFQVNLTHTANKTTGERSGDDDVEEAFVIYKPTGQILWALVDGGGQAQINLQIGGDVFDLLG